LNFFINVNLGQLDLSYLIFRSSTLESWLVRRNTLHQPIFSWWRSIFGTFHCVHQLYLDKRL